MALVDEVQLHIRAGKGGDGVVRWKREKFKPKGGPGGGNGGRGGDVYAEAVSDLSYLSTYRHKKNFKAENGQPGANFSKFGRDGENLVMKFPRGTILKNLDTGQTFDLKEVGEQVLVLRGGRGGLGNEHFKSSRNVTPTESTPGKPGEEADFYAELELFADIGLVGIPSAGKSTLLNALTNANSKVGSYDFTTLEPHLGAMADNIIVADIPGLIHGASEGKGLGHKFLRHIRRTRTLAHLVPANHPDPGTLYGEIRNELGVYDPALLQKEEIVLLSKSDLVSADEVKEKVRALEQASGAKVIAFSAYDDASLKQVAEAFRYMIQ